MATFTLPKNSKISGKGRVHKADGATKVKQDTILGVFTALDVNGTKIFAANSSASERVIPSIACFDAQ